MSFICLFFRSLLCNVLFFSVLTAFVICSVFVVPFSQRFILKYWHSFAVSLNFVAKYVGGINANVVGTAKQSRQKIYACRHESLWETMFLITIIKDPVFVLKKELIDIPLFGRFLKRVGAISVDRSSGGASMLKMAKQAAAFIKDGRSLIIFPEGTRKRPTDPVEVKKGVALLYKLTKCSVVPMALNSGKFWPRRGFIKYPGTVSVLFMDEILPGLDSDEFISELQRSIEQGLSRINSGII